MSRTTKILLLLIGLAVAAVGVVAAIVIWRTAASLAPSGKAPADPAPAPRTITATIHWHGASAEKMESQVTEPIEGAFTGTEGVALVRSESRDGVSTVTADLLARANEDTVLQSLRDALATLRPRLPDDIDPPILQKQDPR